MKKVWLKLLVIFLMHFFLVLGIETVASAMLDKCFIIEPHPRPPGTFLSG
jgi:hypothetical protein